MYTPAGLTSNPASRYRTGHKERAKRALGGQLLTGGNQPGGGTRNFVGARSALRGSASQISTREGCATTEQGVHDERV